jgi:hypothetical protein
MREYAALLWRLFGHCCYKQTNKITPSDLIYFFRNNLTLWWVALEPQMWSFHLSSLDLSVELVQLKDEKVFFSFRRPKLENLIIVPAGDLLMLRHANWLVLFPVHLALASIWLWLWSFVSYQALLTRKIRILVGQKWSYSRITKP